MSSAFNPRQRKSSFLSLVLWTWLLAISPPMFAKNLLAYPDFDGDGKSDLLWAGTDFPGGYPIHERARSAVWLMDGTRYWAFRILADATEVEDPGPCLCIIDGATADHNGDGKSDLLWRGLQSNGYLIEPYVYQLALMNELRATHRSTMFDVLATPDLDGDGKSDVVFSHFRTRQEPGPAVTLHLLDGLRQVTTARYDNPDNWEVLPGRSDPRSWTAPQPQSANNVDFDGDGKNDLVFRSTCGIVPGKPAERCFAIWLMDGLVPKTSAVIFQSRWQAVDFGDFDGDGKSDILWRHEDTGEVAIWLMDGLTTRAAAVIFTDPNWRVIHLADFDGDGRSDLLWQHSVSGYTAVWMMNGLHSHTAAIIWTDRRWQVFTLGDFNGDGRADLVWYNYSTGETAIWLMNGLQTLEASVIFHDRAWKPRATVHW